MTTTAPSTSNTIPKNGPPPVGGFTAAHIPTSGEATLDSIMAETERRKRRLEPQDLERTMWLCEQFAEFKLYGIEDPRDALARIMYGAAIGLPAMASLENISIFWSASANDGRGTHVVAMRVRAKLALLLSRNDIIEYIRPVKQDETSSTWTAKRRDREKPDEYTFTFAMAEKAGLVGRGVESERKNGEKLKLNNYDRHPGVMLQWRACGRLCDIVGGDILLGIATFEEAKDDDEIASQLREIAEEVVAKVQTKKSLTEKLSADPPAAANAQVSMASNNTQPGGGGGGPVAARDWDGEFTALKEQIIEVVGAPGDKAKADALKPIFKAFKKSAPEPYPTQIQNFYDLTRGAKSKDTAPSGQPGSTAAPTPAADPPAAQTGTPATTPAVTPPAAPTASQTAPKPGPACVSCGKPVPKDKAVWVTAPEGWRHTDCPAPVAGFGGPRPTSAPSEDLADSPPPDDVQTVGFDKPTGKWLPVSERGDAYDGPLDEDPPIPFGS